MVNRTALVTAVAASAVACATLVDLGPEATLRNADTTGPDAADDAGAADVATEETATMPNQCGLPPAPNVTCNACSDKNCCDVSLQCANDPRCVEGSIQLLNCVYDTTCVGQVDMEYADAGIVRLQTCVLAHCVADCFPKQKCSLLAGCCKDIPSDQLAARQTCIGAVNQLDESNCQNILDNVLRPQLGAQFCGGPAPGDAGAE